MTKITLFCYLELNNGKLKVYFHKNYQSIWLIKITFFRNRINKKLNFNLTKLLRFKNYSKSLIKINIGIFNKRTDLYKKTISF